MIKTARSFRKEGPLHGSYPCTWTPLIKESPETCSIHIQIGPHDVFVVDDLENGAVIYIKENGEEKLIFNNKES